MAAAGFRRRVSGAARLRPARSWGQEAVALRSGTHSPGCTALSADPWRSQAGTHPHGPHPCHRWPAGSAWLCCGAALSRLRPRRALCGSARQRLPAPLPRLCCGSAPRWADAPVRAAAHDIPGWCTSSELAGWFPVAKPCMHAGQQCRLLNRLPGMHSQPLPPMRTAQSPLQARTQYPHASLLSLPPSILSIGLCAAGGGAVPGQPAAGRLHQLRRPAAQPGAPGAGRGVPLAHHHRAAGVGAALAGGVA